MEIKKLTIHNTKRFVELLLVFKEVFDNDRELPDQDYLAKLLSNPDFFVFVAIDKGIVIAGVTIYVLHQYYSEKPLAYIYDVGVSQNYQGQGIGKSLISHICNYCKENGFEDAYVEAESDDIEAINFYRKTNFTGELKAIHFTYSF